MLNFSALVFQISWDEKSHIPWKGAFDSLCNIKVSGMELLRSLKTYCRPNSGPNHRSFLDDSFPNVLDAGNEKCDNFLRNLNAVANTTAMDLFLDANHPAVLETSFLNKFHTLEPHLEDALDGEHESCDTVLSFYTCFRLAPLRIYAS